MQLVLDIDLDFFLDRVFYCKDETAQRLSPKDYAVDPLDKAWGFLEKQALWTHPTPGAECIHHRDVYTHWEKLIRKGTLKVPFEVIHVDAHADMGLGNPACAYIAEFLLNEPPSKRKAPKQGGPWCLGNGNFLLYALAMGWIGKLTYVQNPHGTDDVQWVHMKDFSTQSGFVQMKAFKPGSLQRLKHFSEVKKLPFTAAPEIPFAAVSRAEFQAPRQPDFVFIAQSPAYTPPSADLLFDSMLERLLPPQLR